MKHVDIAEAHIQGMIADRFDDDDFPLTSREQVVEWLIAGKTSRAVLEQIEVRFGTITSVLIARQFHQCTNKYRADVRKGFKKLLSLHIVKQ